MPYSSLRVTLCIVCLPLALLSAKELFGSNSTRHLNVGPYAKLTHAEQSEAGLITAVETGSLNTSQSWKYVVAEAGDYQLGMAWVDVLTPGTVSFRVSVNGKSVHELVAKPGKGPTRIETRLEDIPAQASIEILAEAAPEVTYRLGFHLLFTSPTFHGLHTYRVADFGAVGDGIHDDMDAIRKAVNEAKRSGGGIVRFEKGRTYRLIGRRDLKREAVFDLEEAANIKIEGNGALLVLHPPNGLANIRKARNVHIDGLFIDYQPKPYFQGRIESIDLQGMTLDLRVPERYPVPEVGSSNGPAPFFGRSFIPDHAAARSGSGDNLYIESMARIDDDERRLRLQIRRKAAGSHTPDVGMKNRLRKAKESGATEFVVPHLRYGHLHGQTIIKESARIRLSNLRWYLVPYFWLSVIDNVGPVSFFNVDLQLKDPEKELYASWRDGFHIKNSRFGVMIDGSDLDGAAMYDDTFAIYSRAHRVVSSDGNRMTLKPGFTNQKDLQTWLPGDWVSVWDKDQSELRGTGRLKSVTNLRGENLFVVELASVPENTRPDDTVINEEVLNRGSVIRNCRTTQVGTEYTSTRFRASDIRFENNHFEDFRFNVEFDAFWGTPRSRDVLVRDCYIGGGQSDVGLRWPIAPRFEDCKLQGTPLRLKGQAEQAVLKGVEWIDAPEVFLEVAKDSSVKIAESCTVDGKTVSLEDASIRKRIKGADRIDVPKRAVLTAEDFGLLADGISDDGPAIQRMLAKSRELDGPVELKFPKDKVICVKSGVDRYAFALSDSRGLRIDGRGSEFRLAPELRFLRAMGCSDLEVSNLKVDFLAQPTVAGTLTKVDAQAKVIEVKLDQAAMDQKLGGPTREDGEQAFFGMIQLEALHETHTLLHYYVDRVEVMSPGRVRVFNQKPVWEVLAKHAKPGHTRIGLPVPGIAHRYGPGALFVIDGCRNAALSHVEVWSAPWFSFQLVRNEGQVTFSHVKVQPKPGSDKVLSSCRDAIHAKGNRASLLFEDCVLTGLGDDAFNLSTHCSRVTAIESPNRITVAQHFPLGHIPFQVGDTLILMDPDNNRKIAERAIRAVAAIPSKRTPRAPPLSPWAPASALTLDRPVSEGLRKGLVAWSRESANPKSIIRRCVIERSCRLQTNTTIEDCDVQALLWFYGAKVEGPGPEFVVVRKSRLRSNGLSPGRANSLIISGWEGSRSSQPPGPEDALLRHVEITDNQIQGRVRVAKALEVAESGNAIQSPDKTRIHIEHCGTIHE